MKALVKRKSLAKEIAAWMLFGLAILLLFYVPVILWI
jgi:hypothetical protein